MDPVGSVARNSESEPPTKWGAHGSGFQVHAMCSALMSGSGSAEGMLHTKDHLSLFPATKKNPRWKCHSARCEPTRSKERAHTRVATIMFWWDFRGGRWSRIPRPGVCFPHFPSKAEGSQRPAKVQESWGLWARSEKCRSPLPGILRALSGGLMFGSSGFCRPEF